MFRVRGEGLNCHQGPGDSSHMRTGLGHGGGGDKPSSAHRSEHIHSKAPLSTPHHDSHQLFPARLGALEWEGVKVSPKKRLLANNTQLRTPACASGLCRVPCEGGKAASLDGTPQHCCLHRTGARKVSRHLHSPLARPAQDCSVPPALSLEPEPLPQDSALLGEG